MAKKFEDLFPRLQGSAWQITSPPSDVYNCIAWAVGDTTACWWPDPDGTHWPDGIPLEETVAAFRAAFATLGYVVCGTAEPEAGFDKIALFADAQGVPKHAARQLSSGRWSSKLGLLEDIEHGLADLEGVEYGTVVLLMKRPVPSAASGKSAPREESAAPKEKGAGGV
ncbi:MAG TPA: hypothetical protein VEL76_03115 [Gemmataceae bacterium]|nr:hypothetical protein [Gemmataceae bacterium]